MARGAIRATVWGLVTLAKLLEDSLSRDRKRRGPPPGTDPPK